MSLPKYTEDAYCPFPEPWQPRKVIFLVVKRMRLLVKYQWLNTSHADSETLQRLILDTYMWFRLEFSKAASFSVQKELPSDIDRPMTAKQPVVEMPGHLILPTVPARVRSGSFVRRIGSGNVIARTHTAEVGHEQSLFYERISANFCLFFKNVVQHGESLGTHQWKDQVVAAVPVLITECVVYVFMVCKDAAGGVPPGVSEAEVLSIVSSHVTFWMTGVEAKSGSKLCPTVPKTKSRFTRVVTMMTTASRIKHGKDRRAKATFAPYVQAGMNEITNAMKKRSSQEEREYLRAIARNREGPAIDRSNQAGMRMKYEMILRRSQAPMNKWYEKPGVQLNPAGGAEVCGRFVLEDRSPMMQTRFGGLKNAREATTMGWLMK